MTAPADPWAGLGPGADNGDGDGERLPSSWRPVDLTEAVHGGDLPEPGLLARADGTNLLYRGRVHWFQGEPETCKSLAAIGASAQVLDSGGRVLWIDFEDDERGICARLVAVGVDPQVILDRFVYIRPDEPLRNRHGQLTAGGSDLEEILNQPFDLAVIDGVTEAMTVEGLALLDNSDVATWQRLLPKRVANRTGAATVVIDHVTKNSESGGRWAIGAQHKLAGLTGAAYLFEMRKPFYRPKNSDPVDGEVVITVKKDRPGWVRGLAGGDNKPVAVMNLTAWPDGGITIALTEPTQAAGGPNLVLCRQIIEHLAVYDGQSINAIEKAVTGKGPSIRDALKWMAEPDRAWLRIEQSGRSHLHYLTDLGRQEFGSR